jgi:ribose/xylose/arabinose/galactoside ABC-type transport system permease subunit
MVFGPSLFAARFSPPLRNRLLVLLAGNLLLLSFIYFKTFGGGASFAEEILRFPKNAAGHLLAGIGLTGIVFAGSIDLSIGAIVVMAGTMFGVCYHHGASPPACFLACFATAVALSAANGILVRLLRIPAIIVTLAGLTFYRGLAILLAQAAIPNFAGQITVQESAYHAPGRDYAPFILLAGLAAAVVWELFGKTPRTWLALGSSREACRLKGLNPDAVLLGAFVAGGIFLGLAAVVIVTNQLTIEPSRMARNFELAVVGAVVLGGTNIFGGEGSYLGTILGGTFLYFVGQSMLYAGVSEYWRTALQGAVIVAVIGADCLLHRRRKLLEELR